MNDRRKDGPRRSRRRRLVSPPNEVKVGADPAGSADYGSWYDTHRPVLRFGLKFGALMAVYYFLVLTPFCERLFYAYLGVTARLVNMVLNLLGQDSHLSALTVRTVRFAITVRRGCDAIEPAWFFSAAVLAFPGTFGRKLLACLAGTTLLQVLNLVRIVSLYFIGLHAPGFFPTAHLEIWPAVFVLTAILLWVTWISCAQRMDRREMHAGV